MLCSAGLTWAFTGLQEFWQDFTQTYLGFETIFTEEVFSGVDRGRVPFW